MDSCPPSRFRRRCGGPFAVPFSREPAPELQEPGGETATIAARVARGAGGPLSSEARRPLDGPLAGEHNACAPPDPYGSPRSLEKNQMRAKRRVLSIPVVIFLQLGLGMVSVPIAHANADPVTITQHAD